MFKAVGLLVAAIAISGFGFSANAQEGQPQPTPNDETVASVTISSSKGSVCAGGVGSPVHQAELTATAKNHKGEVLKGKSIGFSVKNADENGASDEVGSVGTPTIHESGDVTAKFTSSRVIGASNIITASFDGKEATTSISMADVYASPTISKPNLVADGVDSAKLKLTLTSGGAVDGHSISWRIARVTYMDEDDLTVEASPSEFAAFGSISFVEDDHPSTNAQGLAQATYTTGTRGGTIYFEAEDTTVSVKNGGTGGFGGQSAASASSTSGSTNKAWGFGAGNTNLKPPTDKEVQDAVKKCIKDLGLLNKVLTAADVKALAKCVLNTLGRSALDKNCSVIATAANGYGKDPCTVAEYHCQECAHIKYLCCLLKAGKGWRGAIAVVQCYANYTSDMAVCAD